MTYAGIFKRLVAFAIDMVILVAVYAIFGFFFSLMIAIIALPMIGFWFYGGLAFAGWLYFALFESSTKSATPGKQFLGMKVVDLLGHRISFLRATARYFCRVFLPIGVIVILFTKKKQALHDLIASTVVIYSKPPSKTPTRNE